MPPHDSQACACRPPQFEVVFVTPRASVEAICRRRSIPAPATAFVRQLLFQGVRAAATLKAHRARGAKASETGSQEVCAGSVSPIGFMANSLVVHRKGSVRTVIRAHASQNIASSSKRRSGPVLMRSFATSDFRNIVFSGDGYRYCTSSKPSLSSSSRKAMRSSEICCLFP
jgi:hypothetical protein